jgi:hypothetical protein
MAMMLRAGTPSVPSSATGNGTVSPAMALSILGAERTGAGTVWLNGTARNRDKIAARVRFGRIAIRIRTAISFRRPEETASVAEATWLTVADCT